MGTTHAQFAPPQPARTCRSENLAANQDRTAPRRAGIALSPPGWPYWPSRKPVRSWTGQIAERPGLSEHPASIPRGLPAEAVCLASRWRRHLRSCPSMAAAARRSLGPPRRRTGPDTGQISRGIGRNPAQWPAISRASPARSVLVRLANDTAAADWDCTLEVATRVRIPLGVPATRQQVKAPGQLQGPSSFRPIDRPACHIHARTPPSHRRRHASRTLAVVPVVPPLDRCPERVSDHAVTVVAGVLVDHRRPGAGVAHAAHQLPGARPGAAIVLAVCRRSWNRSPSTPAFVVALCQARLKFVRRGVAPFGPTNSRPAALARHASNGASLSRLATAYRGRQAIAMVAGGYPRPPASRYG